jgi:hypothetical protein
MAVSFPSARHEGMQEGGIVPPYFILQTLALATCRVLVSSVKLVIELSWLCDVVRIFVLKEIN